MRALSLAFCAAFTAVACTSAPSAEACARPARDLAVALQKYIDGFADVTVVDFVETKASAPPLDDLARAVARYRDEVVSSRCAAVVLSRNVVRELASLKGKGAIAASIAASLRSSLSRASSFGNATPPPEEKRIAPGDDLASAIAGSLPATRIVLPPGEFRVDEPIVLLDGVSIVGAGKLRTRIVSTASGMAMLFIGNGTLTLDGITLTHEGSAPASMVFVHAGSYVIRGARIAGAKRGTDGSGGNGLVVGAATEDDMMPTSTRVMRIEESEFVGNDASGITIGGNDAPLIIDSSISGSDVCGICYAGSDGGVLRANRITSNAIGVTILSDADPIIEGNTFARNNVGIQVRDRAHPSIVDNALTRNRDAGIAFVGQSRGSTRGNACSGAGLGIVLLGSARPTLSRNLCAVLDQR